MGLLCQDLLERKSTLLLTKTERAWQIIRALVYAPLSALLRGRDCLGCDAHSSSTLNYKRDARSAVVFHGALSLVFLVAYTAVVERVDFSRSFAIYELIVGLAVLGKRRDEIAAFREAWRFVVEHYKVEFGLGLIAGVLFDTVILRVNRHNTKRQAERFMNVLHRCHARQDPRRNRQNLFN